MKVSKEQKSEIRQKLLDAAVALFVKKGFAESTMREISKRAGFSEGTIYNYFTTKEGIFYAYFESKEQALSHALAAVPGFAKFTLKEKLQLLMETLLESYRPDRAFVAIAFKALLDSPMRSFSELGPIKDSFAERIQGFLRDAAEQGEIPEQPFQRFLAYALWDYLNLIVMYWLRDESKRDSNTTRLVDMSLDIYVDVVKSGMVTRAADLVGFLLKSHLYGNIDKLFSVVGLLSPRRGHSPKPAMEE